MYTQCPDCNTAFRVTAEVLRQAAGKVRCGGCGSAFNALDFLSEETPRQQPAAMSGQSAPELTAESVNENAGLPKSISAEQSAALLKTLDQLAGSDIRIEDTGVEWRVLDENDVADNAAHNDDDTDDDDDDVNDGLDIFERASDNEAFDESLDESLQDRDASIIDQRSDAQADNAAGEFTSTSVDQLRFDDNTPLPDDFEFDNAEPNAPQASNEDDALEAEPIDDFVEPQADIALSEPDEWADILGEFNEPAEEMSVPAEAEPGEQAEDDDGIADATGEANELVTDHDDPQDIDTQFGLQAAAMGIDLSGMHELDDNEIDEELDEEVSLLEEDQNADDPVDDIADDTADDRPDALPDDDFNAEAAELELSELQHEPVVEHRTIEDELAALDELELDDEDEALDELGLDEDALEDGEAHETYAQDDAAEETDEEAHDDTPADNDLPRLSEEEQTINRMIDQDLMALAIEDEDGFASTIIFPEDAAKRVWQEAQTHATTQAIPDTTGFESIVMEGDTARSTDDDEKFTNDEAAAAELTSLLQEQAVESESQSGGMRRGIIAACIVLVLVLIVQIVHQSREALATIPAFNNAIGPIYRALGQPLQPEWDITGWRFEATKGSADSQTESTQFDGVSSADEKLTIYSRIGNKSEQSLPYPLIGISLTDRFEETIGSRILDPAEYLSNDLDPRKLVRPGNSFNAVISIQSPSENATGFKLNVCYRMSDGRLRCAIDDFK